ncbi:hypothetical protein LCGC14_2133050 [marine sediment metagenome]|uniref:YdhG-like domain-containing protein n=2 Tax=root TaxID=1 RepID=A0A831QU87_9FLAO|nr:hypothetical protein [Pricia antarctica]
MKSGHKNIDTYIKAFPEKVKNILEQVRSTIKKAAPEAEESISYGMPVFTLCGKPLVYIAGYKNHVGFYATPTGHSRFAEELSGYKQGKGSVQFQLDEPIPYELITQITAFRVKENLAKYSKSKD